MIRLFFFFLLCAMPYTSRAQFGAGSKVTRPIKNTELLVVLAPEYGDAYNDALQAAVNKYWTYTKFKYISGPQYKQYCKDKTKSFLVMFEVDESSLTEEKFTNLGIIQGGTCKKAVEDFAAYANLFTWSEKAYPVECIRAVQIIQNYLKMADESEIATFKNWEEVVKLHNKNAYEFNGKEWLVTTEDFLDEYKDLKKIKKIYTEPMRIVEFDEIDKATFEQSPNIIYHQLVYDYEGYRFHTFFTGKDTKVIFMKQAQRNERVLIGKETLQALMDNKP
jgi:hypothetical protein